MTKYARFDQRLRFALTFAAGAIAWTGVAAADSTPTSPPDVATPAQQEEVTVYYVGSIADRDGAKPAINKRDAKLPAIPVVYEDAPDTAAPEPAKPAG